MGGSMGLVLGQQTEAANLIIGRLPGVQGILDGIPTAVTDQASGFVGGAAAGLANALGDWLQAAGDLPKILSDYAMALAEVDRTAAASDAAGAAGLSAAPGSSGLNLK